MILLVITQPNSAFATIRDSDNKYFWWSIGIFGLTTIATTSLGGWFMQLSTHIIWLDAVMSIAYAIVMGIAYVSFLWFIGRSWGGNRYWRSVFSTISYTYTILLILLIALLPLLSIYEEATATAMFEYDIYVWIIILALFVVATAIWHLILIIKAIKVVNKFSTEKAIVVFLVSVIMIGAVHFAGGLVSFYSFPI